METGDSRSLNCTVVAIDHSNYSYTVCSLCDKTLSPDNNINNPTSSSLCNHCHSNNPSSSSAPKRLFRVLMSVASDTEVFVVVMFDRAARVLFGCSADDFFHFAKLHPFSALTAGKILEGEMLRVTLSKPKNANAQHERVVSVVPLCSGFSPAIETLRQLYGGRVDQ
ncbi:Translation initiation factor IF [Heracleum sosnowskyi]|uniref:Translation initiation factor IF n=1 Tax=Heracleum sosnowskyi TaxID=360622 RepID=A0AAD8J5Z8_9APIA|nr:Translation initiation factor IF [Heracleum sosnowskyi]